MPQRTLLITDFFSKCHSTSASNAALFEKSTKVIKTDKQSTIKKEVIDVDPNPFISNEKPSIPSRIKFVRHQSAPLHHRSPVKARDKPIGQEELEEIRTRIRAFRNDLYKYKSTYSRSPIKPNANFGDKLISPFKSPSTPIKSFPSSPAYVRFSPLTSSVELPLPHKYEVLLEQYKHLDFLVCHTHNNGGISTFEKVRQVIQQKTKR